ncbi:MAG: tRNA pseudouridine(55) synthase TruB [Chitinophagaceae bacterium]|nr:MAG: tRNA pseudouridine(55) synthase TruB [Chitinophagaceae bacterium]
MEQEENIYEQGQVLLINKPYDWTSFDVVRKIRGILKIRKIGHAGTLDPLASGLLILCTGKFTKKINDYMAAEKEYIGSFTLGASTVTYDLESEPENQQPTEQITPEQIHAATAPFTGEVMQVPPMHSAIKKDGKRIYKLARKGKEIELEPRKIFIKEFEIVAIEMPVVHFRIVCSTGTYIRSIANDFGKQLGCGAYLSGLIRTRIGEFLLKDAVEITSFTPGMEPEASRHTYVLKHKK